MNLCKRSERPTLPPRYFGPDPYDINPLYNDLASRAARPVPDALRDHRQSAGRRDGGRDRADQRVGAEPERRDRMGTRLPCFSASAHT